MIVRYHNLYQQWCVYRTHDRNLRLRSLLPLFTLFLFCPSRPLPIHFVSTTHFEVHTHTLTHQFISSFHYRSYITPVSVTTNQLTICSMSLPSPSLAHTNNINCIWVILPYSSEHTPAHHTLLACKHSGYCTLTSAKYPTTSYLKQQTLSLRPTQHYSRSRERHTNGLKDRQTKRQTDRQTDGQTDWLTVRYRVTS